MKIERDKLYRARNGSIYKVVCIDVPKNFPIIGFNIANSCTFSWMEGGKAYCGVESDLDLIAEVREPREWTLIFRPSGVFATSLGPKIKRDEIVRVREILDETP